ncbi:MSMEG_4193 family putative phosphomutase [Mariniluteicoccus flavus]
MTTVFLVRHGRSTANTAGVLAGRAEGVELDDTGRQQAADAAARLADVPLVAAVTSPVLRCVQTTDLLLGGRELPVHQEPGLTECDYGDWTGHRLAELADNPLWKVIQAQPSAVRFPGGEAMTQMSARAIASIRDWDRRIAAEHGEQAAWLAVSHGDVIKAILADALGLHLDGFQRIMVDPASIQAIRYTDQRPYVVTMNSTTASLAGVLPADPATAADAAVGGGLGAQALAGGPNSAHLPGGSVPPAGAGA